jgi:threonine aldolase
MKEKICLASDNYSPAHPLIMEALLEANHGHSIAYGGDPWTLQAEDAIHREFQAKPKVFMTINGTGTNVLALKICCRRQDSVICSDIAHIYTQESGSAESLVGCKLLTVVSENGKITPAAIGKKLNKERAFGKHATSASVLSITQPTEVGPVYSLKELEELAILCREEKLIMHMDGCRLYNAAVALNCSLADITNAAQVDILSLGGTKNGLAFVESLLIFNPKMVEGSDLHKQNLQLVSKMRYLSAQYIPFFEKDLWKEMAGHANAMAQKLAAVVTSISDLKLSYSVESNQLFVTAPATWIPKIQEKILCHLWDKEKNEIRFITSWNTTDDEIDAVRKFFAENF